MNGEQHRATIERLAADDGARLREIRLRALRDAPEAFARTLEQATAWPLDTWNEQTARFANFVAVVDHSDVGLIRGALDANERDTGWLLSMWVAPELRGAGIAPALVEAVVDWARSLDLRRLLLDVVETNARALTFYARMGFVPTGEVSTLPPPRQHLREVRMALTLRRSASE